MHGYRCAYGARNGYRYGYAVRPSRTATHCFHLCGALFSLLLFSSFAFLARCLCQRVHRCCTVCSVCFVCLVCSVWSIICMCMFVSVRQLSTDCTCTCVAET